MQRFESARTEELLLRISFLFAGGFALAEGLQDWIRGKIDTHPEVVLMILIIYAVAFANFAIGMSTSGIVKKLRHVPLVTLVGIILASAYVIMEVEFNGAYRSDSLAFTHHAASLYLGGVNPYGRDLQDALRVFSVDPEFITLTPSGAIITTLNYPALSFLVFVPAVASGITDMRVVILLFEIVALVSIYLWAPANIRPVVLLPVFAGADLAVNFGAGAIGDFIWLLPLVFMLFFIKKPWISGALYGVSCAIKQTPWLLAPFLLIWIYNDSAEASMKERLKRTAIFAGMTAVLFLVPNLQFILQGFSQWWDGVVTPSFGNLVILSQGLSMVSELGYVPLPPHFYSVTLLAVFVTLTFNYTVYFDKLKHAIWVMPMVALWFSYRGLQNYFIFWMPMLVASAVYIYKERARV